MSLVQVADDREDKNSHAMLGHVEQQTIPDTLTQFRATQ